MGQRRGGWALDLPECCMGARRGTDRGALGGFVRSARSTAAGSMVGSKAGVDSPSLLWELNLPRHTQNQKKRKKKSVCGGRGDEGVGIKINCSSASICSFMAQPGLRRGEEKSRKGVALVFTAAPKHPLSVSTSKMPKKCPCSVENESPIIFRGQRASALAYRGNNVLCCLGRGDLLGAGRLQPKRNTILKAFTSFLLRCPRTCALKFGVFLISFLSPALPPGQRQAL